MTVVDYTRSYILFTTKERTNTARLAVEARCELIDDGTGATEEFFFFASCKSEHVYVERNLFQDPNYDFCGIFSQREFALIRTPASGEAMNTVDGIENRFESVRFLIRRDERAQVLDGDEAIIRATLAGRRLVGRTEIADAGRRLRAILEYPIKTINVNAEIQRFQVDTGPLPFPDGSATGTRVIERMKPAFVAYNTRDMAEFILQQPTPILREGREICRVLHYSDIRPMPAQNTVIAVAHR